jgi:hypothetical protein
MGNHFLEVDLAFKSCEKILFSFLGFLVVAMQFLNQSLSGVVPDKARIASG